MHWFKFPPVLFLDMQHHHYHLAAKLSAGVLHVETCELKNHDDDVCWLGKDWRVGYRWRHNTRHMTSFFEKKNARKRCCWNCNIWPNWFTSHQSHCCLYYKGIPEFVGRETFNVNRNIAQTRQNSSNLIVRKSNLREMANFGVYPGDFKL